MCMKLILKLLVSFLLGILFFYFTMTPELTIDMDNGFDIRDHVIDDFEDE